jgi:hypothetical protein
MQCVSAVHVVDVDVNHVNVFFRAAHTSAENQMATGTDRFAWKDNVQSAKRPNVPLETVDAGTFVRMTVGVGFDPRSHGAAESVARLARLCATERRARVGVLVLAHPIPPSRYCDWTVFFYLLLMYHSLRAYRKYVWPVCTAGRRQRR